MKFFRSASARHARVLLLLSLLFNVLLVLRVYHYFGSDVECLSEAILGDRTPVKSLVREREVVMGGRREMMESRAHYQGVASQTNTTVDELKLGTRPVIFVGGVPRSGTTLARAMLDAHPEIRCGEETRVIPRIISMRNRWNKAEREHQRLMEAGLSDETLDQATRAFVSEIILNHGSPAKYLCNKDPLVLNYMQDIIRLFPKAKFVLMIRDGRAVSYSIVTRNITISGVDSRNFVAAAMFWNKVVERMLRECKNIPSMCMHVFYEDLVSQPKVWMARLLDFLEIPWHDNVLRHHELINSEVSLSKSVARRQ